MKKGVKDRKRGRKKEKMIKREEKGEDKRIKNTFILTGRPGSTPSFRQSIIKVIKIGFDKGFRAGTQNRL